MLFKSVLQKNITLNAVLLDIGNGIITGSMVIFEKDQKPVFLYITKEFFTNSEHLEAEKLEIQMNSLLEEVLKNTIKKGYENKYWIDKKKVLDKVVISFSSPWFLSKTKHIHLTNEKEFVITQKFLDEVLKSEVSQIKAELKDVNTGDVYDVVESSIVHGKINGYTVNELINKETKSFEASLYISVVNDHFKKKVFDTIQKVTHLDIKDIILNTFPLVLFSVIRDLFTKEENFLLFDVTSEVTDITLVTGDIIEKTVTFPSGKNLIVRQLAKNLGVTMEIAESTLKLYSSKKINDDIMLKVASTLADSEKEWSIYLENALLELSPEMVLPHTMFLTADDDIASIFNDFLVIQKLDATSAWRKNLKINRVSLDSLSTFYDNQSGFILNEFIVILALFYKKIMHS